jgi:hypothetical protein
MWKFLKVEYLGRIEYDFQKSCVAGPWDHKVSVSAKNVSKKISCLCTFKWLANSSCGLIESSGVSFQNSILGGSTVCKNLVTAGICINLADFV